jgi:hypothetical protein
VIVMTLVTVRQAGAGAGALVTGPALVGLRSWTLLLGLGFSLGVYLIVKGFRYAPITAGYTAATGPSAARSEPTLAARQR